MLLCKNLIDLGLRIFLDCVCDLSLTKEGLMSFYTHPRSLPQRFRLVLSSVCDTAVCSLLMSQLTQDHAKDWALCRLTTIGEACRAMLGEILRTTLAWAIEQVTEKSRCYDHVVAKLRLT